MALPDMSVIETTLKALKDNRMEAYYAETSAKAEVLAEKLCEGATVVSSGGSVTLAQTGIIEYLKNGPFEYADRFSADKSKLDEVARKAAFCDVFFTSSNAVTQQGELYNVDGVLSGYQRTPGRIKVIIVGEELGY